MEYITYRRFHGKGICGRENIPFGTIVDENNGFLFLNGRCICAVTSENAWNHFRPNTQEGAYRQELLTALYLYYQKHGCGDDFADEKWPAQENGYWKNRLRTASTVRLETIYRERIGGTPCTK